jgi:hypothetical protein
MNRQRSAWIIAFAIIATISGCGGSGTHPVEGKVVFTDGTPVPGGLVIFELIGEGPAKVCARGDIQADGTFRLSTFRKNDGALPGRHRVSLAQPLPTGGEEALSRRVFHARFESFDTSKLEFTIEPRKNEIKIEVDRP